MRILHVVQGYTPAIGGTERLIQKVSEKLVARHGDAVTVFTTTAYNCELFWRTDQPQLPAGTDIINGVTVRRFPVFNRLGRVLTVLAGGAYLLHLPYNDWVRTWQNGPIVPGLEREIIRSDAEVVAASSFPLLHMHTTLRAGQRKGIPVVLNGGIHTADAYGFNRPMIYRTIRAATAYIANTQFEADYLMTKGVAPEKIHVIGVGVDLEPYVQADPAAIRRSFGWSMDAPVIAFVGQQVPHKGVDMLLAAMPVIWGEYPDACLLLAGARTSYSSHIDNWLAELSPQQRAHVGVIHNFPEEEKADIFAACDMLAFPSAHESFGIVVLEAWAAGKPVIGVRVDAITSVVDEGKNGILIRHRSVLDLVAAIRTFIHNPALARELGENGRQKVVRRYTWDLVADRFRDVYQQSIKG